MRIVLGILAGVIAGMWVVGATLPVEHRASRAARYAQPREINREGHHQVQRLPNRAGKPAWIAPTRFGEMRLEAAEREPHR